MVGTSSITAENRADPEYAAIWFENLCPADNDRLLVLQQLVASINLAQSIAPEAWSLTLSDAGFRLNVGSVEALTFKIATSVKDQYTLFELRVLLHGATSEAMHAHFDIDKEAHTIFPSDYKSVPQPQHIYMGLGDFSQRSLTAVAHQTISEALTLLQPLHASFIAKAAVTSTGKIRESSSFYRSHSKGLYLYAKDGVDRSLSSTRKATASPPPNQAPKPPEGEIKPRAIQNVITTTYVRSEAVKAWVLQRSNGTCECCAEAAPFNDVYDQPYLEVHHLKQLADGGSDRVSNTVALCPNCHRQMHHGKNKLQLRTSLFERIDELRSEYP